MQRTFPRFELNEFDFLCYVLIFALLIQIQPIRTAWSKCATHNSAIMGENSSPLGPVGGKAAGSSNSIGQQRKLTTAATVLVISITFCEDEEPVDTQRQPGSAGPAFVARLRTHKPHWSHQAGRWKKKKKSTKKGSIKEQNVQCAPWQGEKRPIYCLCWGKWLQRFGAGARACGSQVTKMAAISWGLHLGSRVLPQKPKLKGHERI